MLSLKKSHSSLIPVRIGALLISAGVVRADQLALALAEARRLNAKLGEVLIANGLARAEELHAALELQSMIKTGKITVDMATKALRQVRESQRNVFAALSDLGWTDDNSINATDLASVLVEAGIVTRDQINQASWNAGKNMLPLGRNLVLAGAISPSLLGSALTALVLLRDRTVERHTVLDGLRKAHRHRLSIEECLQENARQNHVRVGELLSAAGLLSESDAMIAVENGLLNQQSIGTVLLESRMVSPVVLDACLKLQKLIAEDSITRSQASELLRQVASKHIGLEHFLNEMTYLKSRVLELLLTADIISQYDIECAIAVNPTYEEDIIRALTIYGLLTQEVFRTCVRCVYAIDNGVHSTPEVISTLRAQYGRKFETAAC